MACTAPWPAGVVDCLGFSCTRVTSQLYACLMPLVSMDCWITGAASRLLLLAGKCSLSCMTTPSTAHHSREEVCSRWNSKHSLAVSMVGVFAGAHSACTANVCCSCHSFVIWYPSLLPVRGPSRFHHKHLWPLLLCKQCVQHWSDHALHAVCPAVPLLLCLSADRYYYYYNSGLQQQYVLYGQDSLTADPVVLLDPNTLSDDGTIALKDAVFSDNGAHLAYSLSSGGSDWSTIKVNMGPAGLQLLRHAGLSRPEGHGRVCHAGW